MKARLAAVACLAIAFTACSGGEGPEVVEPLADPTTEATAIATMEPPGEVVPPAIADTADATVAASSEKTPTPIIRERAASTPALRERRIAQAEEALSSRENSEGALPTVEFPGDIALLILHYRMVGKEGGEMFLQRIYWSGGELVRETIFPHDAVVGGRSNYGLIAAPDTSSLIQTYCVEPSCGAFSVGGWDDPLGRFALNESRDGGVTWEQLVEFKAPDVAERVLPGGNGDDRLVLISPWHSQGGLTLWPSGETVREPDPPQGYSQNPPRDWVVLDDGQLTWAFSRYSSFNEHDPRLGLPSLLYLTADGEDVTELVMEQTHSCPGCLMLPDGRLLQGLTVIDPETGERGVIELPPAEVPRSEDGRLFLAIQRGPFLRVTDVDGCLPIWAEASHDSEELACMAERVLLTDTGETTELDGATWHSVRTPAGIEVWADGRYLE